MPIPEKSIAEFCRLIITNPLVAFPNDANTTYPFYNNLLEYFKLFFFEDLGQNDEIKKIISNPDKLLQLRANTYCYLFGIKEFNFDQLLNRFELVNKLNKKKEDVENLETREEELAEEDTENQEINESLEKSESENSIENGSQLNAFISDILLRWSLLEQFYKIYIEELKQKYTNEKIEKIIIYEAPPYCGLNKLDHFFLSGGNYLNCMRGSKSQSITHDKELKQRLERSISEILEHTCGSIKFKNGKSYALIDEKTNTEKIKSILNNFLDAINSDIVYIDLMMIPFPFTSSIRKKWSSEKKYNLNKKQLPVHLLDWAVEKFLEKINVENILSSNCKIAIGTPLLTSTSIFEFYSDQLFKLGEYHVDLSRINSPMAFKKMNSKATIFPLFKSNVVGASNYPEYDLVRNAFNILV